MPISGKLFSSDSVIIYHRWPVFVLHCCVNSIQNIGIELTLLKRNNFQAILFQLHFISLLSLISQLLSSRLIFFFLSLFGLWIARAPLLLSSNCSYSHRQSRDYWHRNSIKNTMRNIFKHQSSEKSKNSFLFIFDFSTLLQLQSHAERHWSENYRFLRCIETKQSLMLLPKNSWVIEYNSEILFFAQTLSLRLSSLNFLIAIQTLVKCAQVDDVLLALLALCYYYFFCLLRSDLSRQSVNIQSAIFQFRRLLSWNNTQGYIQWEMVASQQTFDYYRQHTKTILIQSSIS